VTRHRNVYFGGPFHVKSLNQKPETKTLNPNAKLLAETLNFLPDAGQNQTFNARGAGSPRTKRCQVTALQKGCKVGELNVILPCSKNS
jgi:hypothetical protein